MAGINGLFSGITLTTEQAQKLSLNQSQIQSLSVLQMTTEDLTKAVMEELLSNPVLEEDTNVRRDEDFAMSGSGGGASEYEKFVSKEITLHEHLEEQIGVLKLDDDLRELCEELVGCIDDDGYMDKEGLPWPGRPEEAELLKQAIAVIQDLDPVGVGSRDLKENLLKQIDVYGIGDETVRMIVEEHLDDIAENRIKAISKETGLKTAKIVEAIDLIKTLEPRPGSSFATNEPVKFVFPEIRVEEKDGELVVSAIDGTIPKVMLNNEYTQMHAGLGKDDELKEYLGAQIGSAKNLMSNIEHRKKTILDVAAAIVERQKPFFLSSGAEGSLAALTMKEIAQDLGIHESTVSRAVNGKYMQFKYNTYELKSFFSSRLVGAGGGGAASSSAAKSRIKAMIDEEDKHHPISDQKIADRLKEEGIDISRRTVAKYREEMEIPSTSKRKKY